MISTAEKLYQAHCKFYQQAPVKWDVLATVTKTYWTFMAGDGDLELRQGKVVALGLMEEAKAVLLAE